MTVFAKIRTARMMVLGGVTSYFISGTDAPLYLGGALIVGALIGSPMGASFLNLFDNRFVRKSLGQFYAVVALSVITKVLGFPTLSIIILGAFTISLLGMFLYRKWTQRQTRDCP